MPLGKIKKLVHLSQQTYLPRTQLVPDRNDKGYGLIEGDDGQNVYFPHNVVEGYRRFDWLRKGQLVEYTLEDGPYNYADWVMATTETKSVVLPATQVTPTSPLIADQKGSREIVPLEPAL